MGQNIRLDLLLKEIDDKYVQENFRKLKRYLECIEQKIENGIPSTGGGDTNIINNVVNNNSPWTEIENVPIPAGNTVVLDSQLLSNTECGEYKVCIVDAGGTLSKNFNVKFRKTDTGVETQVFGKSGDAIDISVCVVRTPTTIDLEITNNESYSIETDFSKINI